METGRKIREVEVPIRIIIKNPKEKPVEKPIELPKIPEKVPEKIEAPSKQ